MIKIIKIAIISIYLLLILLLQRKNSKKMQTKSILPKKFPQYIALIINNFYKVNFGPEHQFLIVEIFRFFESGGPIAQLEDKIAQILDDIKQQIMSIIIGQVCFMKTVFRKMKEISVSIHKTDLSSDSLTDLKFDVFYLCRLINRQMFEKILKTQLCFKVHQNQVISFYKSFNSFLNQSDDLNIENMIEILKSQFKDFEDLEQSIHMQIALKINERIISFSKLREILEKHQIQQIITFFDWIENLSIKFEVFKTHSASILQKNYKKFINSNEKKKNNILEKLYRYADNFQYDQIRSILKEDLYSEHEEQIERMIINQLYKFEQMSSLMLQQSQISNCDKKTQRSDEMKSQATSLLNSHNSDFRVHPRSNQNILNKSHFSNTFSRELFIEESDDFKTSVSIQSNQSSDHLTNFKNDKQKSTISKTSINKDVQNNERKEDQYNVSQFNSLFFSTIFKQQQARSFQEYSNLDILMKSPLSKKDKDKIGKINQEICKINSQMGHFLSLQTQIRKLQLSVLNQNSQQIIKQKQSIEQIIEKYELSFKIEAELNQILQPSHLHDKLAKVQSIKRKTYCLNLEFILSQKHLNQTNHIYSEASGLIIIGQYGVGKSTINFGLAGHKLIETFPKSGKFLPEDRRIAQQYYNHNSIISHRPLQLYQDWTSGQTILTIQTPSLNDNQEEEINILNNIGMIKILNTLKKGRILIVLSNESFRSRGYNDLVGIIRSVSKYLLDIKSIKKSLTFVLTQELDAKTRLERLEEFYQEIQTRYSENWNQNEKEFIGFMMQKMRELKTENQIENPNSHEFEGLVQKILQIEQTENIGKHFKTSFSDKTEKCIQKTFDYLKTMVEQTFLQAEFPLTKFYLNRILNLEEIYKERQEYQKSKENIKSLLRDKVNQIQNLKNQFLIYGIEKNLDLMKEKYDQLNSKENIEFFEFLYEINQKPSAKGESSPEERIELMNKKKELPNVKALQLINDQTRWLQNKISQFAIPDLNRLQLSEIITKIIEPADKKQIIYSLQLMRQFASEKEYKKILEQIQKHNQSVVKYFSRFLETEQIEDQECEKLLCLFGSRIQTDIEKNNNEFNNESEKIISGLVQAYFKDKCKDKVQISNLIERALHRQLDCILLEKCNLYIQKLNLLKKTLQFLVEQVDPQLNWLIKQLRKILTNLVDEIKKQKDSKNFNPQKLKLSIRNFCQIYQILTKLQSSNDSILKWFEKMFEQLVGIIKDKNQRLILIQLSESYTKNWEQIGIIQIKTTLQQMMNLKDFVKNIISVDSNHRQLYFEDHEKKIIQKTLENIEKNCFDQILNKIDLKRLHVKLEYDKDNNNNGNNKNNNNKLLVFYWILKFYQSCQFHFHQQQRNKNIKHFKQRIIQKIESPLKDAEKLDFDDRKDYIEFEKILKYIKSFEDKIQQIFQGMIPEKHQLKSMIPLLESRIIDSICKKVLDKMLETYNLIEKTKIIETFSFKSVRYEENGFSRKQEQNSNLNLKTVSMLNSFQTLDKKSLQFQQILYLYENRTLLKQLSDYLLKFNILKKIGQDYQLLTFKKFIKQNKQMNLKNKMFDRIETINDSLQRIISPIRQETLQKVDLTINNYQLTFILRVFEDCNYKVSNVDIQWLIQQVNLMFKKQEAHFDSLYQIAKNSCKNLQSETEFDNLKILREDLLSFKVNNKNRQAKVNNLLMEIQSRYKKKLSLFIVKLYQNTHVLLNIGQFCQFILENRIKVNITLMDQNFQQKCYKYFSQLYKTFHKVKQDPILSGDQKSYQRQLNEQRKILFYLPALYHQYITEFNYKKIKELCQESSQNREKNCYFQINSEGLQDSKSQSKIQQRKKEISKGSSNSFEDVHQVQKSSQQMQLSVTQPIIQRFQKQLQQLESLLPKNHGEFKVVFQSLQIQLKDRVNNYSPKISTIKDKITKIKQKYDQFISNTLKTVNTFKEKNNLDGILLNLKFIKKINNIELQKSVQQCLQQLFKNTKEQNLLSISSLNKQPLLSYKKKMESQIFKEYIQQSTSELKPLHQEFINSIKKNIKNENESISRYFKQQLGKYKILLQQKNPKQKFTISKFDSNVEDSFFKKTANWIHFLENFSDLFDLQYNDINAKVELFIESQVEKIQSLINAISLEFLQPIKKQEFSLCDTKHFAQQIQSLSISMEIVGKCNIYFETKFFQKYIKFSKQIINDLRSVLKKNEDKSSRFNFLKDINFESEQDIIKSLFQTEQALAKITELGWVISYSNLQKNQILQHRRELHFAKAFEILEIQVIQDVQNYFKDPLLEKAEKVHKFYMLKKTLSKLKDKLKNISKNVKDQGKVKSLIMKNFENKIKHIFEFRSKMTEEFEELYIAHFKTLKINTKDNTQEMLLSKFMKQTLIQHLVILYHIKRALSCEQGIIKRVKDVEEELCTIETIYGKQFTKYLSLLLKQDKRKEYMEVIEEYQILKPFKSVISSKVKSYLMFWK